MWHRCDAELRVLEGAIEGDETLGTGTTDLRERRVVAATLDMYWLSTYV